MSRLRRTCARLEACEELGSCIELRAEAAAEAACIRSTPVSHAVPVHTAPSVKRPTVDAVLILFRPGLSETGIEPIPEVPPAR